MSKFKIKGNLNGEVKSIQVERGITPDLNEIKNRFERAFGTTGLTLKYRYSDGRFEALYQSFHMEEALQDALKSGAKYLTFQLSGGYSSSGSSSSSSYSAPPAVSRTPSYTSSPPAVTRTPSYTSSSPSPSSGAKKNKFCENCGSPLSPMAKFCSSCGATV